MKVLISLLLIICSFPLMAADHANQVGVRTLQRCTSHNFELLARYLQIQPRDLSERVIASACTHAPSSIGALLISAAVSTEDPENNDLLVLLFDQTDRLVSSYRSGTGEDAGLRLGQGSIWVDTAPYQLSPDVRAFAIDLTSGYIPNCGDGGYGAIRSLYVSEGTHIRPVLLDMFMSEWEYIQHPQDRCNSDPNAPKTGLIEEFGKQIQVDVRRTNGFHDLIVTGQPKLHTITEEGKDAYRTSKRKPIKLRLKYDGKEYQTKDFDSEWWRWRS